MVTRSFTAMGTAVCLSLDVASGPRAEAALDRAERVFEEVEEACSRFRADSELSRLNRARVGVVSPLLADVLRAALDGRVRTHGLFDPTVHDAVVAAGYDRTFDHIDAPAGLPPAPGGAEVTVEGRVVRLGPGASIDLGGIAKGYAADRACTELSREGGCLVDAGGDIALSGTWVVAVEDGPSLELTDAAVATSGRDRRRWRRGEGEAHHLIDPATGAPAVTSTLRATVVAPTATEAEILAKAAFLGARVDAPTVLAFESGETLLTGGLV